MGGDYSSSPTLKQVSATFYDESTPGNSTTAVGDGNVTSTISYYDASNASNFVETIYHFNWRNLLRGIQPETSPFTVIDVDFMGRSTASAQFVTAPTWSTVLGDDDYGEAASDSNRRSLSTTEYDQLGRVYQTAVHAVSASGSPGVVGNKLVSDRYYDRNSNLVAAVSSGSAAMEYAYDGANRRYQSRIATQLNSSKYSSGAFSYRAPVPKTSLVSMSGGDDKVLELSHSVLSEGGEVEQSIRLEAHHTDTDGLDASNDDDYVQTAVFSWYDAAHRLTDTANYGTGTSSWSYAALPNYGSVPARSDTVLVTSFTYSQGRLEQVTDPKDLKTRYVYDALDRRTYVIENYDNFDESNETNSGDATDKSKDRVTRYVYNGLSQTTQLVALDENADGNTSDNQTTKYLYEDPYNASLVTNIIYPDSADTDSSGTDQVKFAYHLDGTVASRSAQPNFATATFITYSYDDTFHRPTIQGAATLSPNMDSTIRSIKRTYDSMGRIENITSYATADATGGASNDVQYAYDDMQALSVEYQEHAGAVNTGTSLKVQYGYDTTNAGGIFTKGYRLSSMTYPSGRVVHTLYADAGDSSGIGDAISRVTAIASASTRGGSDANVFAAYYYNGMGRTALKDLPQPDVRLDYFQGSTGTYAGFDRFGRIIDHRWYDYGASADRERFKHGYDRNSNRTYRDHTNTTTRDGFYTYDGLNRLTDYDRGDLNGTFSAVGTLSFAQKWDLKALGNWTAFKEDANGNGSFTEAGDLNQTRTHNAANEITGITETGGQVAWADPTHDPKGNIATYPNPSSMTSSYAARYDAWNRLGRILGADPVGDYIYDGLGRRITKKTYVGGSLDKTRQFFYSNSWQVIEERVDERTNDLERQYVWGIGYVDELILRDKDTADDGTLDQRHYALQDANFSLTCIVDTNGDAAERYLYTPYGVRTCLDGSFANPSANGSYDWNIGHQGLMHDTESSLIYNRHRMLHPGLGRFMQRDPLEYVDGMSLYEYLASDPTNYLDAMGEQLTPSDDPMHDAQTCSPAMSCEEIEFRLSELVRARDQRADQLRNDNKLQGLKATDPVRYNHHIYEWMRRAGQAYDCYNMLLDKMRSGECRPRNCPEPKYDNKEFQFMPLTYSTPFYARGGRRATNIIQGTAYVAAGVSFVCFSIASGGTGGTAQQGAKCVIMRIVPVARKIAA